MFHLPDIFRKIQGFQMWSDLFQNHSRCFVDTSLHIIKCLKYKMFHNFLRMFHLPDIFWKIQGFEMWSDLFQNHSKCFVDTSQHIIKCLKCKMFHDFLGMFHLPDIFRKIKGFYSLKLCNQYPCVIQQYMYINTQVYGTQCL
jgi:hypothetical protein